VRSIPTGARLFAAALAVYSVCPPFTSYDSYYVVPTALSLLRHGTTAVDEFVPGAPAVSRYAVEPVNGHWYNYYPFAVPVLTAPLIGAIALGTTVVARVFPGAAAHAPHPIIAAFLSGDLIGGRPVVELLCGALIGAAAVWVVWATLGRLLPSRHAIALTVLFAFGTTQWSIASRNLMQHGLSVLLLSIAIHIAVVARERPRLIARAAIPVALSFTVRPSNCIAVVVFTIYVAVHYRRELPRYLACAAPVAAVFFAYNLTVLGRVFPRYFLTPPMRYPPVLGLAANLVSPARGLLINMPIVLFAVAGIWLAWRRRWLFPLSPYLAAIPVLHLFFIAPYWAGHCFGPRYFSDMTPFFVVFLAPVMLHRPEMPGGAWRHGAGAAFVVLALWGLFVNFRGATSTAVVQWSAVPVSVDNAQWRIWDWSDPPFLRGLR
jgi:hypothetical protein